MSNGKKEMTTLEYICPMYHERLRYFIAADVFTEEELSDPDFNTKFHINARYRDIKLVTKQDFPGGYPVDTVKFDNEGYCLLISVRAMHRILCREILSGRFHFMFDPYVKWQMYDYDNEHGSIVKFMIHTKNIPIKGVIELKYVEDDEIKSLILSYVHIDDLWNLDGNPGMLIYYYNDNDDSIASLYIDSTNIERFTIKFLR